MPFLVHYGMLCITLGLTYFIEPVKVAKGEGLSSCECHVGRPSREPSGNPVSQSRQSPQGSHLLVFMVNPQPNRLVLNDKHPNKMQTTIGTLPMSCTARSATDLLPLISCTPNGNQMATRASGLCSVCKS